MAPAAVPDFTGTWLFTCYDGDMEAFLKSVGCGFFNRTKAKAAKYGQGSMEQVITSTRSTIKIVDTTSNEILKMIRKDVTTDLMIDDEDTEQETQEAGMGRKVHVKVGWSTDGKELLTTFVKIEDDTEMPWVTRRYLKDDNMMVLKQSSATGEEITRYFTRKQE